MRWRMAWLLAGLVVLPACKREPSFDERYAGAQKAISDKAKELDADMVLRASDAPEAGLVTPSATNTAE